MVSVVWLNLVLFGVMAAAIVVGIVAIARVGRRHS
jgi:hypothetical protein